MRTRPRLGVALLIGAMSAGAALGQNQALKVAKPLTGNTPLPDPLTFADGRKVSSPADWPARRTELLGMFQEIEYGKIPPAPVSVTVAELISHSLKPAGTAHRQYKISCVLKDSPECISFVLDLMLPKTDAPAPVILRGDGCWGTTAPEIKEAVLARGYALAEFNRCEFAPDSAEQTKTGLHVAYPDAKFGCLAAWAWGYHRAVDALATLPWVDKTKIAITGHSRGGKATLLAGATDERVALVNPNASGCGGSGCFRDTPEDAETLKIITTKFPFWFEPRFQERFAGREAELPFDQHELKACVAPRALLTTEGINDVWANPRGTYRTHQATRRVYEFLGASDKIAIHYRPGGHEHGMADWSALLDFADQVFAGKKTGADWNADPFAAK